MLNTVRWCLNSAIISRDGLNSTQTRASGEDDLLANTCADSTQTTQR